MKRLPEFLQAALLVLLMASTSAAENFHDNLQEPATVESTRAFKRWQIKAEEGDAAAQYKDRKSVV